MGCEMCAQSGNQLVPFWCGVADPVSCPPVVRLSCMHKYPAPACPQPLLVNLSAMPNGIAWHNGSLWVAR